VSDGGHHISHERKVKGQCVDDVQNDACRRNGEAVIQTSCVVPKVTSPKLWIELSLFLSWRVYRRTDFVIIGQHTQLFRCDLKKHYQLDDLGETFRCYDQHDVDGPGPFAR
jgi:hypothetical protein